MRSRSVSRPSTTISRCADGSTSIVRRGRAARLISRNWKEIRLFRVYETGWPKADTYFSPEVQRKPQNDHPVVLYPPTFTRNVCSAPHLMAEIDRLAKTHPWDWVITFHPKLTDPGIIAGYKRIAEENENVIFYEGSDKMPLLQQADVMLCDSSSIILEFMFLDKPVVTFRNSHPGPI